jgi:hypothetical protein
MRKINFSIVMMAALLLAVGFVFTACDTGGGGSAKDILDGTTWVLSSGEGLPSGGLTLTFNAPNVAVTVNSTGANAGSGTYQMEGNSFTGKITVESYGQPTTGTVSGKLSADGKSLEFTSTLSNGLKTTGTATKK